MAHIEISNLNSAGSDLFAGADSFLNELQTTETTQIFGGYHKGHGGRKWKKSSYKCKKTSYKPCKPPIKVVCKPAPCVTPPKKWC
jgi:hypothetical protein